jgi:hypothetical protein
MINTNDLLVQFVCKYFEGCCYARITTASVSFISIRNQFFPTRLFLVTRHKMRTFLNESPMNVLLNILLWNTI